MLIGPAALGPFDRLATTSPLLLTPPAVVRSINDLFPDRPALDFGALTISRRNSWAGLGAIAQPPPLRAKSLAIEIETQIGNTCGPTALSMTLLALGFNGASPQALTAASDYHDWLGTSPQSLAASARAFGAKAVVLNNSSLDEIRKLLDANVYCIALVQSGEALHYVVIHGYTVEADKSLRFKIADPNGSDYPRESIDFAPDWRAPRVRNFPTGISQMIIAVSKQSALPTERFGGWCRAGAEAHSLINRTIKFVTESVPQACSTLIGCCALPLLALLGSNTASELFNLYAAAAHFCTMLRRRFIKKFPIKTRSTNRRLDHLLDAPFSSEKCSASLVRRGESTRKSRSSTSRYVRAHRDVPAGQATSKANSIFLVDDRGTGASSDRRGAHSRNDRSFAA